MTITDVSHEFEGQEYFSIGNAAFPVFSASGLKTILPQYGGSPKKAWDFVQNGSNLNSEAIVFGTMLHKYFESPETFKVANFEAPTPAVKAIIDLLIATGGDLTKRSRETLDAINACCLQVGWGKSYKEDTRYEKVYEGGIDYYNFKLDNTDPDINVVKEAQMVTMRGIVEAIKQKNLYHLINEETLQAQFMFAGVSPKVYKEKAIVAKVDFGDGLIVYVKIKADLIIDYGSYVDVIDTKTSSKSPYEFSVAYTEYGYDLQEALYQKVIEAIFGKRAEFYFLVCGKVAPIEVALIKTKNNRTMLELSDLLAEAALRVQVMNEYGWHTTPDEVGRGYLELNLLK